MIECDVLVSGSNALRLSAAVKAAWRGLQVIVVEKEPVLGSATARCGGTTSRGWKPSWTPGHAWSRSSRSTPPGSLKRAIGDRGIL